MSTPYQLRIADQIMPMARALKGTLAILALAVDSDSSLLMYSQDFPPMLLGLMHQWARLVEALDALDTPDPDDA